MASTSTQNPLIDNKIVLNTKDLRQCSLVCRAWTPICQAYLFKFATVDSGSLSNSGPAKGILQAIAAHPKIASYVQNIRYTARVPAWLQAGHIPDQNVSTLLALPNVRSLYIVSKSAPYTSPSRKFDDLCAGDLVLLRLWEAYISSTSLVDLTFWGIDDFPLAILLSCPNLKSLTLTSCDCVDLPPQPASNTVLGSSKIESLKLLSVKNLSYAFLGFLSHLQHLSVCSVAWRIPPRSRDQLISVFRGIKKLTFGPYGGDEALSWVYFPLSIAAEMGVKLFEQLQDLTVVPESEQEAEVIYETLQHAPNIRYLDVDCHMSYSSLVLSLNLHQFLPQSVGNLKTLHIRFSIEGYEVWSQCLDTIKVISEALPLVNSPASLTELVMSATIDSTQLLALFGMMRKLILLDTALFVESSMFPLLRWITIRICINHFGGPDTEPNADEEVQTDLYECIQSAFQAFRQSSSNSRINFKLWVGQGNSEA